MQTVFLHRTSIRLVQLLLRQNSRLMSGVSRLNVNGISLAYTKQGTGSKVVLCLPGALGAGRIDFKPQLDALSAKYTMIAWDPPGYGDSRPPSRDFKADFFREDAKLVGELMEGLGIPQYDVLGWSDGGITGIILAAQRPRAVRCLAVWGSNAYVTEEDVRLLEAIRDVNKWSERMRKPFEEMYGAQCFADMWSGWIDAFTEYKANPDGSICIEEVKKLECPTLVLHGSKDPLVPCFHPDFLCKHIANVRRIDFPDGKHNIHLRYAEEFNSYICEFLEKNSKM